MTPRVMRSAALLLALAACSPPPKAAEPVPAPPAASSASTTWVAARTAKGSALLEAPARLIAPADAEAVLSTAFRARIVRLRAQVGDRVSHGSAILDVVMPELLEAAAAGTGAQGRIEAWEKRKAQLSKLDKEGLARLGDVVEAESQLADARAALEQARARLQAAGLSLRVARALLDDDGVLTLRSPVSGVVTELEARLGETREAGTTLARIVGAGTVKVEARLTRPPPEGAEFSFVGPGGEPLAARLQSAAPRVDPRDGTYAAWFSLDARRAAPAGTPGVLRVEPGGDAALLAVPASAIHLGGDGAVVFVRGTEGARAIPVDVLAASGAQSVIRPRSPGALAEGTPVAAEAAAVAPPDGAVP